MSKLKGEADKVDEVRLNYVLCFSVFYFLLGFESEMYEDFLNKYVHWNKYNFADDSDDDDDGDVFNYQTPSEYHHLSCIFFMLLHK